MHKRIQRHPWVIEFRTYKWFASLDIVYVADSSEEHPVVHVLYHGGFGYTRFPDTFNGHGIMCYLALFNMNLQEGNKFRNLINFRIPFKPRPIDTIGVRS